MGHGFPLQLLLDRAQEDLDSAAKQLGAAQRDRTAAAEQLDALLRYRDEYHARFAQSAQNGMPAGNWRNFQAFIDTLDAAIAQQRTVLAAAEVRIDEARPHWQQKKRTVGSYEILQARGVAQEAQRAAKREQRDADEHAAKILRMRADAARSS
ncbi:TPA: flagellar export protein FliJ [Burkholderia cenocepacia]|uniref:flagellar export protein FliJ n=1 Tax=unclassified Burkholderia TaxID=2613784 RepID=UPI00158EE246|nr:MULTISPECIES: flagellar export protein FliJ [unclassified Burkholderia]HEF5873436.1 flagellar export protein FliJ [Burkholderia cenocepacia]